MNRTPKVYPAQDCGVESGSLRCELDTGHRGPHRCSSDLGVLGWGESEVYAYSEAPVSYTVLEDTDYPELVSRSVYASASHKVVAMLLEYFPASARIVLDFGISEGSGEQKGCRMYSVIGRRAGGKE